VQLTDEPDYARHPSWSPDGAQLVFSSPRTEVISTIWAMDAVPGGSSAAVVSAPSPVSLRDCVWSSDGGRIAYSAETRSMLPPYSIVSCDIYTIAVLGGTPDLVCRDTELIYGLDWSPDGSRIVFSSTRGGDYDIWVVPSAGGNPLQLTHDPALDSSPACSPDGSRIAFSSSRTGNYEIWLMAVTGEDPTQITFGPGDKDGPSWSPDGKGIAFSSRENGRRDIWLLRWE
jgi:Tol biopolymer transport system component